MLSSPQQSNYRLTQRGREREKTRMEWEIPITGYLFEPLISFTYLSHSINIRPQIKSLICGVEAWSFAMWPLLHSAKAYTSLVLYYFQVLRFTNFFFVSFSISIVRINYNALFLAAFSLDFACSSCRTSTAHCTPYNNVTAFQSVKRGEYMGF